LGGCHRRGCCSRPYDAGERTAGSITGNQFGRAGIWGLAGGSGSGQAVLKFGLCSGDLSFEIPIVERHTPRFEGPIGDRGRPLADSHPDPAQRTSDLAGRRVFDTIDHRSNPSAGSFEQTGRSDTGARVPEVGLKRTTGGVDAGALNTGCAQSRRDGQFGPGDDEVVVSLDGKPLALRRRLIPEGSCGGG
jgi:hypothetical protein